PAKVVVDAAQIGQAFDILGDGVIGAVYHLGLAAALSESSKHSKIPVSNLELFHDQSRILRPESDAIAKSVPDRGQPRALRHVIQAPSGGGLPGFDRGAQNPPPPPPRRRSQPRRA